MRRVQWLTSDMAKTHQFQWLIAGVAAQVRNKILGAARVERVMLAHGDSLAEQRIKEQRELWEYYAKDGVAEGSNTIFVDGRPHKVTWRSLVMDSTPASKRVVVDSKPNPETGELEDVTIDEPWEGVMGYYGLHLVRPLYPRSLPKAGDPRLAARRE